MLTPIDWMDSYAGMVCDQVEYTLRESIQWFMSSIVINPHYDQQPITWEFPLIFSVPNYQIYLFTFHLRRRDFV